MRRMSSSSGIRRRPDALAILRARPNVAVLRTFSKAYGLAGLRVGYALAGPDVAAALRKTAVPFGVSMLAQEAAIASLAAYDELAVRVDALVAERGRVIAGLRAQGWDIPDSRGELRLARTRRPDDGLRRRGRAVRPGRAAVRRIRGAVHGGRTGCG